MVCRIHFGPRCPAIARSVDRDVIRVRVGQVQIVADDHVQISAEFPRPAELIRRPEVTRINYRVDKYIRTGHVAPSPGLTRLSRSPARNARTIPGPRTRKDRRTWEDIPYPRPQAEG